MRDMHSIYFNMATKELRTLKSEKYNRTLKLRAKRGMSYMDQQELRKLTQQIGWIEAVLQSRQEQQRLF